MAVAIRHAVKISILVNDGVSLIFLKMRLIFKVPARGLTIPLYIIETESVAAQFELVLQKKIGHPVKFTLYLDPTFTQEFHEDVHDVHETKKLYVCII